MSIFQVETQNGCFLFASEAEASAYIAHRAKNCPWECLTVEKAVTSFSQRLPDNSMEFGPNQENCKRIQRRVYRWWRDRNAWWATV